MSDQIGSANSGLVVEGSEAGFIQEVIEESAETPVVVYFRADWCGPCKTFGPALEKAVRDAGGSVKLVKIDVDANQRLAAQMGVQSIPSVFAFKDGRPVDGFMGAQSASQLAEFIAKIAPDSGNGAESGELERAESLLKSGAAVEAAQIYAMVLSRSEENPAAYGGLIRANLALGELQRAEGLLNSVPESIAGKKEITAARAQLEIAKEAAEAGPIPELRAKLEGNPDEHGVRCELATALHASGKTEEAIDELLELFRRDREWNDGAARSQLIRIFDSLEPNDPVALKGRRRLSSLVFM